MRAYILRAEKTGLSEQLKLVDVERGAATIRQAVAERLVGRLNNFESEYAAFVADATADCAELGLDPRALIKIEIDRETPTKLLNDARAMAEERRTLKTDIETKQVNLQAEIDNLTQQLDAPNLQYQQYLEQVAAWENRLAEIRGDEERAGSIAYLQKQIRALDGIPAQLTLVEQD